MREPFIEADLHGDAPGMAKRKQPQRAFVLALALAEHRELAEGRLLVRGREQHSDALLLRETADRAEERRAGLHVQAHPALQGFLIERLALERARVVALRDQRIR